MDGAEALVMEDGSAALFKAIMTCPRQTPPV
jgi:hypothetical protein